MSVNYGSLEASCIEASSKKKSARGELNMMKYVLDNENDKEEPEKEDSDFEPEDEEDP